MFASILQADLFTVVLIQVSIWLFGATLVYSLFQYSQSGIAETEHNPIVLFLASLSGEPYESLSRPDFSIR